MYELVPVTNRTYYINCPAKIGIYLETDKDIWLIDSGNDKDAGRKIQKILIEQGWSVKGILNTHSNADHVGGNQLLQDRLGCPCYGTAMENIITENPILEPTLLYGGYPMKSLQNKFLMAKPSKTTPITEAPLPEGMEIIPLKGHFLDMYGVKTPDNVYFLADCVFGEPTLEKYHISFIYDVAGFLETLDFLETLQGTYYIPSHAEPTNNLQNIITANREKVLDIQGTILTFCQEPYLFEGLLQSIFDAFSLVMDLNQYVLVGSTIRSYLSYLVDKGELEYFIEDNQLFWKTK